MNEISKAKHTAEKDLSMADQLIEGAREKLSDLSEEAKAQGAEASQKSDQQG